MKRKSFYIGLGLLALFIIWTVALWFVDVGEIGPQGSSVGFATLNKMIHNITGVHMSLYIITDWLGLVPICFIMGFGIFGLCEWIKRKNLFKVDFSILTLGGFYIIVMAAYIFFEMFVVNYRPILINGMVDTKPEEFGEGLLKIKKKNHEDRIRRVTDIPEEESCRIVSYFSNIDKYEEYSSDRLFKEALLFSGKLPMQQPTINLNANTNVRYAPSKEEFERKASDLEREFKIWFDDIIKQQDSVGLFALAPQPLLFKLGSLINDQYNVSVYQCHRRANKWSWLKNNDEIEFKFYKTLNNNDDEIALVIDLSTEVDDERITSVLGDNISVFHLSVEAPNRNFVTNENIQSAFVECFRKAMEELKNLKNSKGVIHVFPVMPNSLAIKAGMDYMPKADLPLVIYEQSKASEGFFEALTIGG